MTAMASARTGRTGGTGTAAGCADPWYRPTSRCTAPGPALRRPRAAGRLAARAALGERTGGDRVRGRGDPARRVRSGRSRPGAVARLEQGSYGRRRRPGLDLASPPAAHGPRRRRRGAAELVLDVICEEFAHLLGVDPQRVDPSYPGDAEPRPQGAIALSTTRPLAAEPRSATRHRLHQLELPARGDRPAGIDRPEPGRASTTVSGSRGARRGGGRDAPTTSSFQQDATEPVDEEQRIEAGGA